MWADGCGWVLWAEYSQWWQWPKQCRCILWWELEQIKFWKEVIYESCHITTGWHAWFYAFFQGRIGGPSGNDEHADGDECNFVIGYDEYQQDSLDMHWKVMATTFRSEGDAYNFYNQYAKERGFNIRRDLLKRGMGAEETMLLRRYLYLRAGKW